MGCHSKVAPPLESIVLHVLAELEDTTPNENALSDKLMSVLNCVFQPCLRAALDLVDKNNVTRVTCPSGREMFQVKGTTYVPYIVLSTTLYCTCPSYVYTVLKKKTSIVCKHILAVYVAKVVNKVKETVVTDKEFSARLLFEVTY